MLLQGDSSISRGPTSTLLSLCPTQFRLWGDWKGVHTGTMPLQTTVSQLVHLAVGTLQFYLQLHPCATIARAILLASDTQFQQQLQTNSSPALSQPAESDDHHQRYQYSQESSIYSVQGHLAQTSGIQCGKTNLLGVNQGVERFALAPICSSQGCYWMEASPTCLWSWIRGKGQFNDHPKQTRLKFKQQPGSWYCHPKLASGVQDCINHLQFEK